MQKETLLTSVKEAQRFIEKARVALDAIKVDSSVVYGSKETATALRASMDLTRALADLRQGR